MIAAALLLVAPAIAQGAGWEASVRDLAPVLRACLADRPGAMVVDAAPGFARVLLPGGAREDCSAAPGGSVIRRAVEPADRRPDEGLRAFMLERRCVDAWRVEDAAGRELGWLAYPGCG